MIEMSAEWRTFEDSSHDPRRCGGMENPHLSDGGMSTCIGNATTFGQSSRLVRTQQMQTGCSTDDLIRSHIKHVEDLSADMSLPQAVSGRAIALLAAMRKNGYRSRVVHPIAMAAAALYRACEANGTPRLQKQIAEYAGVTEKHVHQCINLVHKHLDQSQQYAALGCQQVPRVSLCKHEGKLPDDSTYFQQCYT